MSAPYMKLYCADYMADTRHLSLAEHGAYMLLLMCCWRMGGKIENDDDKLAKLCGCSKRQWLAVKDAVLSLFTVDGNWLFQARLVQELHQFETKSGRLSANGKIGGHAKARKTQDTGLAIAKQMPAENVANATHLEPEPEEEAKASSVSEPSVPRPIVKIRCEEFDQVWTLWPQKGRSAKSKALALWKAKGSTADAGAMLAAVRRYLASPDAKKDAGAYVPALERWIRDRLESWLEVDVALNTPTSLDFRLKIFADTQIWDEAWGPRPEMPVELPLLEASR